MWLNQRRDGTGRVFCLVDVVCPTSTERWCLYTVSKVGCERGGQHQKQVQDDAQSAATGCRCFDHPQLAHLQAPLDATPRWIRDRQPAEELQADLLLSNASCCVHRFVLRVCSELRRPLIAATLCLHAAPALQKSQYEFQRLNVSTPACALHHGHRLHKRCKHPLALAGSLLCALYGILQELCPGMTHVCAEEGRR